MTALVILLIVASFILGFAASVANREYRRAFAQRYRDIPPIIRSPFTRDEDPEVEAARRRTDLLGYAALASFVVATAVSVLNRVP